MEPLRIAKIKKVRVCPGVYWVEIPQADLFILCGCPADSVKLLKRKGLIETTEKQGTFYETGPNTILLSDVLIQNGSFSNLTEFPVMQMLYLQGMIIPGHPNNKGSVPMLIGTEEQVEAQLQYIYQGNYGLTSEEEIRACGIPEDEARDMMRIKLKFAFGRITPPENLVDKRIIATPEAMHLKNQVFLRKLGLNVYEFTYEGEQVVVDLNLRPGEKYEAPYQLGFHHIQREYFSVVHSGEGDGWDINRPCMASVLIYQGKIYLVDAGPNILTSLNYLGISVNEIEGIFHTHAHDDHFAGLTTLIRTDRRFKYFATPLVRTSVARKLCALMSVKEEQFSRFFDIHDLTFDVWNSIEGLEVMPAYSPHPIETNIFYFRVKWNGTYKSYGHLADVVSTGVLSRMIAQPDQDGISLDRFKKIQAVYLQPTDLKKIDIGGGMIHGQAEDYRNDASGKLVLAHTSVPLTMEQREIGTSSAFGMVDVLIPAHTDLMPHIARKHLHFYFPQAPEHDINLLLNYPITHLNAGSILFKKGQLCRSVFLLLTGSVQFSDVETRREQVLPAGSLIGFYANYLGVTAPETYWAASNIMVLELPNEVYQDFIEKNNLYQELKRLEEHILYLENTWLFGEVVSFPIQTKLARLMNQFRLAPGQTFEPDGNSLYLMISGQATLMANGHKVESLKKGDFFGGESMLFADQNHLSTVPQTAVSLYQLPADLLVEIPVVHWKLLETYEKRMKKF